MLFDVCLNRAMRIKVVNVEADSMEQAALQTQQYAQANYREAQRENSWPPLRDGRTRIAYTEVEDELAPEALVDRVGDEEFLESRWLVPAADVFGYVDGTNTMTTEASGNLETRRTLVISTGHLTPATRQALVARWDYPVLAAFEYGWYVLVPADANCDPALTRLPQDLQDAIAFARHHGFHEIKFDCDALPADGLAYFADEETLSG